MRCLPFALLASALACAGCGASADPTAASATSGGSGGQAAIEQHGTVTLYEGDADARGLAALRAARPEVDALTGPAFDTPIGGSELDGAFTFEWHVSDNPLSQPGFRGASSVTGRGAMSGSATLITFASDSSAPLMRLFTTKTSYTPDDSARKVLAIGTWVFATLETAVFDEDALATTSDPVIGQSIPICVDMN